MGGMEQKQQELNSHKSHLLKVIDFGFEVQAFLESNIGKYLTQRAEGEVDEALEALKQADPTDAEAIRALQSRIARAESFLYWLGEAYQEGISAQQNLHNEEPTA